ncbi:ImmA/IrrE family metallo-endopeptidase [Serratia inhibens]|uniref:ImmA/IrrE family metallo-endopeptidase n=1 Tax=Serratia inhibens TaxID=2338073 RepID=UPI000809449E|nr:ImmA/IrrE family metallo-endopeptidase [Serratia inhibens]ANS43745.1 Metallopeptidase ImmA [Serratia inhibens PRI-2C]
MAFIRAKKPDVIKIELNELGISSPDELLKFAERNHVNLNPLDVSRLTTLLGVIMRHEPLKGEDSGSLKKDKKTGEWVMTVNSLHHPNRQRFTIAHELGHFIKHSSQIDFFEDKVFFRNGETNDFEIEANKFAAELLMPELAFRDFIENSSKLVSDIADFFHVSSMAVRVRAKQLGFEGHNL